MNDSKRNVIDILLDKREGDVAEMVYHDEDPGEIRTLLRERGHLQGDDDELAEEMWDWVADEMGVDL